MNNMRCNKCNAPLAVHDIWCMACGTQSPVVKNELSALASLQQSYRTLKGKWTEYVPAASIAIILGVVPIVAIFFILHFVLSLESSNDITHLLNLIVKNIVYAIFLPMLLLPFSKISTNKDYALKLDGFAAYFKPYGRYLLFTLINAFFLVLFNVVCFGLPGFASDPILRLVWLVLINYWLAIILPAVVIMEYKQVSPLKAIGLSYRHLGDLRWNIYLLALVLTVLNLVAFTLAIFPLLFSLPLSYFAIRDYTHKLIEYELLDYRIK